MSLRRPARATFAALLALAATPTGASAGAGEGVGYRLTGQPDSTLTAGFIRLPAGPGTTVSAQFIASNSTNAPVTVRFYGADGETTKASGAVYGSASPSGTGRWLSPSHATVTLPAKSELPVSVSVRVPPGTPAGDHVSAVIMEQLEGSSTATVKQVVRYAIPLLVDIAGGSGAQLAVGGPRMAMLPGTDIATVIMPMTNGGSRICRPVVAAHVAGRRGDPVVVSRQLDEVLPGDRILYPLRMNTPMTPGQYVVKASVTGCGVPSSSTSSVTLDGERTAGVTPTPGSDSGDDESAVVPVPLKRKKTRAGSGGGAGSTASDARRRSAPDSQPSTDASEDQAVISPVVPRKPKGNWISRAGDAVATAARKAPEVLAKASVPLGASALVGLLFFLQNALDRRDPKLAAAPRDRETALRFDPNPLQT